MKAIGGVSLFRIQPAWSALLALALGSALLAQNHPLAVNRQQYTVAAGERIAIDAPPGELAFMRSAKTRIARASDRTFPIAPERNGGRMLLGVPLTTEPGDYAISLSFVDDAKEERTATIRLTVEPFAQPAAASVVPPVVLLDGFQLSLSGACSMSSDSSGTFGNLQTYLQGSPNNVPNVYFFENCTECPGCSMEQLGADLAAFLNKLPAPQVDVVAHSMGGLIVRAYLAGKQAVSGIFSPPATQKIRKAVFVATPHFGSFQADSPLAAVLGSSTQLTEMKRGSQFAWDLATWNQFSDDLRGVDAVAVIGNAGPSQESDGVVGVTSASLDFAASARTRVIAYCHVPPGTENGLAGGFLGCTEPGIAYIDSTSHPTYQIASSFLMSGTVWQSVGNAPANDTLLSQFGGVVVADVTASDQYVTGLSNVAWSRFTLTNGGAAGKLFYDDFVTGTGSFSFGSSTCGPYTETPGVYSAVRCKAGPDVHSVGPLAPGAGKVVQSGGNITISGERFGGQCSGCKVTAASIPLPVSGWTDSSITAALPASYAGLVTIGVTTAAGSDAINILAASSATPSVVISGVTNSASGMTGAVAPGELVSIYGSGLGPASGVGFKVDPTTGGVDTMLAGTTVLFGTVAAPITYASAGQINAIVPYEMAGQSQVVMQVQSQLGTASQTVEIVSAAPGAFTVNSSGSGQAAALNQDATVNGPSNPAAKGSYVTIYFTGGGQTNPPGVTGSVTAGLKWLTQSISVTVGNQPATVSFDGSAPTYVDGLDQLNIQLSPNTPSGAQAVVISIAGIASPPSATIVVQ